MLNSKRQADNSSQIEPQKPIETPSAQLEQNLVLGVVLQKTKKCDWCKKRKTVEQGYWLGKFESEKDWFICQQCNLEKEVV